MTTSATGRCSNLRRPPAGFTLLEVLVVVLIIGIVLTFAVLAIGGDRRAEELERESRQFAELLRLGGEQAVLRGEEWAVQIEPEKYRFLVYDKDAWQVLEDDELFRPRELAGDTRLELVIEGRAVELETREEPKPTLIIMSSGEVSPFVADFSADATETRYRVESDARGEIRWELAEE